MRTLWIVNDLDDIRKLQNQNRLEGDDLPCIGTITLDTSAMRVVLGHADVSHEFTLQQFIQCMAQECSLDIEVK